MNNSPYSKGSFRMSTNASNANKINNRYKPPKLTEVQKNFGAFRPVKGFRRFGKGIIADTGEDPNRAYIEFLNKDIVKPLYRPTPKEPQYVPDNPLKWSVGCTKKCNSPDLLPKIDPYRDYYYSPKKEEEVDKYLKHFIDTDHISIRVPEISKSYDSSNSFLIRKANYGSHAESKAGWVPRTYDIESVGNRNSVPYNIINNTDSNVSGAQRGTMLDRTLNNKKKGVAEFSDFTKPSHPNFNKEYQDLVAKDPKIFMRYKGIFSELYDSAWRNGNIYVPFRNDEKPKKKEAKKTENDYYDF